MPPYSYSNLTPEQREEIVSYRRLNGYPEHAPPHPYRDEGFYLITAATYQHEPVLTTERRTNFEQRLHTIFYENNLIAYAWVILPNHYHALIETQSMDSVSAALQHLHGVSSCEWNKTDGLQGKRKIWYHFNDRSIRNQTHFYKALNYIHHNPVKHGFVQDVYQWIWSSLPLYLNDHGKEWLRDKGKDYPPGEYGEGWDT
jgi:putative transposase